MKNSATEDALGSIMLLAMILVLCIGVVILGLVFVILVALLFLWWVLIYWVLRVINDVLTNHLVTESEGLLALILPALVCPLLVWLCFPRSWITFIAAYASISPIRVWLYLIVGSSLISLGFGFLSLLMLDREGGQETIREWDGDGLRRLSAASPAQNGRGPHSFNEGLLFGEDVLWYEEFSDD